MPPQVAQEPQERSTTPSASAAQRALRQQLRFLRELTEFEDAALQHRPARATRASAAERSGSGSAEPAAGAPSAHPPSAHEHDPPAVRRPRLTDMLGTLRAFGAEAPNVWDAFEACPARQPLPPGPTSYPQPPPCAFLRPGQRFSGTQRVAHWAPGKGEHWAVDVTLHDCDPLTGRLCGTMMATAVPQATAPVVTFFEGQIIDNVNASFYTTDWGAVAGTDLRHWTRFPAFAPLRRDVLRHGGRAPGLAAGGAVFMRWKEQFFVEGGECRLTIAGFYYVALDRKTGAVEAYYYDPQSSPDQRVTLQACRAHSGHAFPAVEAA